jgi:HEAT repeat protein
LTQAFRAGDDALFRRVVARLGDHRPTGGNAEVLLALDAATLDGILPRLARESRNVFLQLADAASARADERIVAAFASVADDVTQDPFLRLKAAGVVAARGGPARETDLLRWLASDALRTWSPGPGELFDAVEALTHRLPEQERNRLLLRVLHEADLSDRLLFPLLSAYVPYAPHGDELSVEILRRWAGDATEVSEYCLLPAIERAGSMAGRIDPDLVVAATRSPHPDVAVAAVDAMGRLRDPAFLPALRDCLRADWMPDASRNDAVYSAIEALTAYMSDEAARILLEGATEVPGATARTLCMQGVKTIRDYQRAREEWERLAGTRATRDDAVFELVAMLDDEDPTVRAESLRGLALLGAVEHLPRVIRSLKDADAGVRNAAREALDRLNATSASTSASGLDDGERDPDEDDASAGPAVEGSAAGDGSPK